MRRWWQKVNFEAGKRPVPKPKREKTCEVGESGPCSGYVPFDKGPHDWWRRGGRAWCGVAPSSLALRALQVGPGPGLGGASGGARLCGAGGFKVSTQAVIYSVSTSSQDAAAWGSGGKGDRLLGRFADQRESCMNSRGDMRAFATTCASARPAATARGAEQPVCEANRTWRARHPRECTAALHRGGNPATSPLGAHGVAAET